MSELKKRLSNFEMLRIVSIILIIAHHYSVHGNWIDRTVGISFNNLFIDFLAIGGKIGVVCFILIAGYFGIVAKFSIKKVIKLILQVLFYTIGCIIIFNIFKVEAIKTEWKVLIKSILPITFSMYWFITVYIVLYILSPFINKFIKSITKKEYETILIILISLCCVIPTFTTRSFELGEVALFICIYMIGAYINLYLKDYKTPKKSITIFIISYIIIFISQGVFEFLGGYYTIFANNINYFAGLNSIFVLTAAISLFIVFKDIKIQSNFINYIAQAVFGVYIIHENYFVRKFLWQVLLKNNVYYNSNYLILHAIISILAVYVVCTTIELIRIHIIEKHILKQVYKLYDNLEIKTKKIISRKKV